MNRSVTVGAPGAKAGLRARWMEWALLGMAFAAAVLVFELWPGIDLALTQWFYSPAALASGADGFPLGQWRGVWWLYVAVPWFGRLALVTALVLVALAWWRPSWQAVRGRRRAAAAALVMVLGGWLIVNEGLKEHWGRPRPSATSAFGGSLPFQPALKPSALCQSNCSFVSGHAATGFCLMSLGLFGAPLVRRRWMVAGWTAGCLFGLGRVVQGAHFTSDVLFSGLVIWATALTVREVWLHLRAARLARKRGRPTAA